MFDVRSSRHMIVAIVCAVAGLAATASAQAAAHKNHAVRVSVFSFAGTAPGSGGSGAQNGPPHQPMNKTLRHTTSSQVPNVAGTQVIGSSGGAVGFAGLDDVQQITAGTGLYANSQLDLTPPDQGLCVGQGDVIETINDAVRVYSTDGSPLTAAVPLNQFVGTTPESVNGGPPFGSFISDPRCYYDPDTQRWFMTFLQLALVPSTGAFGTSSLQYIAVSTSPDPTKPWNIYSFPTTNDGTGGTPSDPGCPCFGDQPLFGADANGVYITTNEYPITGPGFNGAQLYAMSKTGLESGTNTTVTLLQPGMNTSVTHGLGGVAFSVEPAESPNSGYDSSAGGTEYFQSALDFGAAPALGTRANSIAVWNLTNTSSLNTSTPAVALHVTVVPSEEYTQPPNATQESGTLTLNDHLPLVDGNDDRMMQVVYAGGHLWSGLNTGVKTQQGSTVAGSAWFATTPSTGRAGAVSASLAGQGYVGVTKEDLLYPSIGVTPAGKALITFTLVGPDYHPSAAWAPLSLTTGPGAIHVAAAGSAPVDDFSSLKAFGGTGSDRWGDYSAAVSDTSGTVWMGNEYINGLERGPLADWATFVYSVTP